jgi:hypothetical protein
MKKQNVVILHDARPTQAAARELISQAGKFALVKSRLILDLYSCATLVVPELGEKEGEKLPRTGRRRSRLDPRTPSSEIDVVPPVVACLLA